MVVSNTKEFPLDAKNDGYIFLPVNLQGIMEFGTEYRRFKHTFPKVFQDYLALCVKAVVNQGDIKLFKSGNHDIILAFNPLYVFNNTDIQRTQNDMFLCLAIQKVIDRKLPLDKIYIPKIALPKAKEKIMNDKTYKWIVLGD